MSRSLLDQVAVVPVGADGIGEAFANMARASAMLVFDLSGGRAAIY